MQFIKLTALVVCAFTSRAMAAAVGGPEIQELSARQGRPVAFNVAPLRTPCGEGTTIFCSPFPGSPCAGNFDPIQASIVVTEAAGNCHINLYALDNQAGNVVQVLNTDTTGTCVFTSIAEYKSYEIICN
ncbi:hypothetical protein GALMADRAFT_216491 [Galerina marginata CBS 339.88]|uniref:Uncharacterized protein n=1 Tax=Galerina marginata (strain CBS 339.88) TaxID=685588 RepID=A0A067SBU0_GALM3|nr:hypothetical protein GALMADRAFT_216491 [Galerina marginata CBS 339.88]